MLPSPMRLKKGRYVARFAANADDLRAAQHLRYLVFRDPEAGPDAVDQDAFDAQCQHVLIEDSETEQLVCCFRMQTFENGASLSVSYAAQSYDLKLLYQYTGPLIEIGRFGVLGQALDADILRVAWAAVAAHVDKTGATMLFGCSSFEGTSATPHREAFALLKDRYLGPAHLMPRQKPLRTYPFAEILADAKPDMRAALKGMPPLLRTYLAMGGWVSDHAVIDDDLGTLHVFTAVEIASIPPSRVKALRALVD